MVTRPSIIMPIIIYYGYFNASSQSAQSVDDLETTSFMIKKNETAIQLLHRTKFSNFPCAVGVCLRVSSLVIIY